jgi:hypothetical protein
MPFGDFINGIPPIGFLVVHVTLFLVGSFFAWRSYAAGATTLGAGFALFAIAEISYMTYHLNWTTFLFAHTISEVLNLGAFVLVFAAVSRSVLSRTAAPARG